MFNDMNNLIGNFFNQADDFIKKQKEEQKQEQNKIYEIKTDDNTLSKSHDETTKYQVMGDR